ncbi:hypothetical protein BGW39_004477, partial [Mortierella sp. 14UC]
MLGEALVGSIEQFWFAEIRKTRTTYKTILDELEDSFVADNKQHLTGSVKSLRECKQQENENIKVFLLWFERALARHKRAMDKKRLLADDMLIMQALYAGVKSYKIAKVVRGSSNLRGALSAAKKMAEEENQWS